MRTKHLYLLELISFVLFVAVTAFTYKSVKDDERNKDIIIFSHQFHAEMDLECSACHAGAAESTSLSDKLLPDMETCAECHDVEDDEYCEDCHYGDEYEALIESVPEIIFNHKLHLTENDLACEECHYGFAEVDYSFEAVQPKPSMNTCYKCHNNFSVAANACESCHISTDSLIPETHERVSFFDNHKFTALEAGADCAMCHDNNFCESCHVATNAIDADNTPADYYTPFSPHRLTNNKNMQQITLVHELNYRYTHGIDANGKETECQTCHQTETFCAECHSSEGGDFAMGGFAPSSHSLNNFVTVGVGTGGGEHAILAKRDIQNCVSCHDIDGGDPNCTLCHVDNDGIEGTNPKTHEIGFMSNTEGEWHGNLGAVCYNCHTDPFAMSQTYGQGFCGYCHK